MTQPSVTKMSSKGQVVIPEPIRRRLGLDAGTQFVVVADDAAIVLRPIIAPSIDDFDALLERARNEARTVGLKPTDIVAARDHVRGTR